MRLVPLLAIAASLSAADWLSSTADAKHTRFQPAETDLAKDTVADLKLLWKLRFDEPITAPIVLGPIFTHRGIKELVFVAGKGDNLYALDADLARIVWRRHFETAVPAGARGLTAAPVLAPYYGPAPEGDDASTPRRSLFVLTSDGQLHTVRPADARDLSLPVSFVPPGSAASDLTLSGSSIATDISGETWRLRLDAPGKPLREAAMPAPKAASANGYAVTATANALIAARDGKTVWTVDHLNGPLAPVIANNLVFAMSGTTLLAIDLPTGRRLYASGPNGAEPATASMAVANGHVYFIAGQTIYCYGFPIEI